MFPVEIESNRHDRTELSRARKPRNRGVTISLVARTVALVNSTGGWVSSKQGELASSFSSFVEEEAPTERVAVQTARSVSSLTSLRRGRRGEEGRVGGI